MKLSLMWQTFGPYHRARLRESARLFASRGSEVVGLEVASRVQVHAWKSEPVPGAGVVTLFPGRAVEDLGRLAVFRRTLACLDAMRPDAVAVPAYSTPEAQAGLIWARKNKRVSITMVASKERDSRRAVMKEIVKRVLIGEFDAAIAGGSPQARYIRELGVPVEHVFVPYDVVDNAFYADAANRYRTRPVGTPPLRPRQFFLASGRFIARKNFERLIRAFADYHRDNGVAAWDLVILGQGPLASRLKEITTSLDVEDAVVFPGYRDVEEVADYYAAAGAFIHPALVEQWGLVVNEAMAAGLPILASDRTGATEDLVRDGHNGYLFDPEDRRSIADAMTRIARADGRRSAMSRASVEIVADWSLERFAEALWRAAHVPRKGRHVTAGLGAKAAVVGTLLLPAKVRHWRTPSE